jgi:sugar phosphate isomerase/epimerase
VSKIFISIWNANSIEHKEEIGLSFDARLEYAKEHHYNLEFTNFISPDFLDVNGQEILKDYQQKLYGFKGVISIHGACGHPVIDVIHGEDEKVREAAKQMIFQSLEIARELKAERIVFHGNFNPLIRGERYKPNWIERDIIFWSEVLEKYPSTVVLENTFELTPEIFRTVLDAVNSSRLKVCLDMGHINVWSKAPLEEWIAVLGEDIHSMHIHDNKGGEDSHLAPGKGAINWQEFSDLIAKYQIGPDVVFEVKTLETTIQSLKYFREGNIYPFNTFAGNSM